MTAPLKHGPWRLTDLTDVPKNGRTVFSCFHCGGGSTMGYKLAGFTVLGGVEIDPEMMAIYRANHKPKHSFLMGVQDFKKIPGADLPAELFNLDILDGSPPCSSFSMAGAREKDWSKEKKFREGQAKQILDDLFFHFIDIAAKLKPKVVVAENVKGLIQGNARGYVKEIFDRFREAGYHCQLFLMNASLMGVPQRRERTFFIARRRDLGFDPIKLAFDEEKISVERAFSQIADINYPGKDQSASKGRQYYDLCQPGESFNKYHPSGSLFTHAKIDKNTPSRTMTANFQTIFHYDSMRLLSKPELFALQTFPQDYQVKNDRQAGYICGMSVPPFMMQRIALEIDRQWFEKMGG